MATQVSICSNALMLLGATTITSLDDGTTYANLCKQFYAETRDGLLRKYKWKFAMKRASLAQDALYPASWDWKYGFTLPSDCLAVRTTSVDPSPWDREGNWLVTNESAISIKYTSRIEDTSLFDPCFVEALEAKLAMRLCKPVTGALDAVQVINAVADKAIAEARTTNAFEATDITPPDDVLVENR